MQGTDAYTAPREGRGGDFMMGMLWGTAVGVAIGLLLAPSSGAEFRGQIANSADRVRRKASSTFDGMSGTVNNIMQKGRSTYGRARDAVDDFVDRGRNAVDRGRETFAETAADVDRSMS